MSTDIRETDRGTVKERIRGELEAAEACGFKLVSPVEIDVLRDALTEIERLEKRVESLRHGWDIMSRTTDSAVGDET